MPLIVLTASSILSVTSVSICSGAAPGCTVACNVVGLTPFGDGVAVKVSPGEPRPTVYYTGAEALARNSLLASKVAEIVCAPTASPVTDRCAIVNDSIAPKA